MNGADKVSLFVLCAAFLGGVIMSYRGMNGTSELSGVWRLADCAGRSWDWSSLAYYRSKSFCNVPILILAITDWSGKVP